MCMQCRTYCLCARYLLTTLSYAQHTRLPRAYSVFFFLMIRRPPRSTLFPYTRSSDLSVRGNRAHTVVPVPGWESIPKSPPRDRKSTRLNSSHLVISYAVFCLKKKNKSRGLRALLENK